MGINDFNKKYKLHEIVKGDSLFCATGITNGDLVSGLELKNNKIVVNTLITHKSQKTKKIVTGEIEIEKMISISGKEWKEYKIPKRLIDKYSSDFDISENLSKFYLIRNFNKEDVLVKNITNNNLNIFSKDKDFLLASEMITDIIKNKQKTLIFGDYDVDGISSITILSSFFKYLGHPFKYVIPDRFIDGYGPNIRLLEQNLDKEIDNIIFLDCGSNSHEVINHLKTKKLNL